MQVSVSKILMFFLVLLMLIQPVQAKTSITKTDDAFVCMNATQKFEEKYGIKEHFLTTISSVESGRWNKKHQQNLAWPWTINAQGKGYFYANKAEAVKAAKKLQKQGVRSMDVGCMQINLQYHPDAFASIEDAFDPEKNVEYGAKFLKSLYSNKGKDWFKAAMAYHSSVPRKALRYKKKIVSVYETIKQAQLEREKQIAASNVKKKATKVADARQNKLQKSKIDKPLKTAQTKKIENLVRQDRVKKQRELIEANRWREERLAEYRQGKIR